MLRTSPALVAALALAACGGPSRPAPTPGPAAGASPVAEPAPAPAPQARQLAEETAITAAWGATVAVPASWFVTEAPDVVRVQDPERELEVTFVAVQAAGRDAAIAAAWAIVAPGFDLPVAQAVDLPARDGWDAVAQVAYVTPADGSRVVVAVARRAGDTWHVNTIDGTGAALGRRGAQVGALLTDLKVPGVEEESFAGKPAKIDADRLARFDAFVEEARALAGVPGAAVAVVHGGKVVLEQGYGVRVAGKPAKVTPDTRFMIGSTTKSLTTLLLARLIDQGKLAWDTPVVDVLPSFALADAAVTKQVQVQHTVCACTGMPRQDLEFLFEYAGWDAERRLASMAAMKPTTGFGETFQYSNVMVATGGWLAGRAYAPKKKLNAAYDAALADLVLRPLGMKATTFDLAKVTKADHARPHGRRADLSYAEIPLDVERAVLAVSPAGAAWSTVRDLARYMLLELAGGKTPDGKQLVSADHLLRRRQPQVKIDEDSAYGLGLFVGVEHGVQVVHHGGNTLGFTADLFLLPEHDAGVVVLTNAGAANGFRGAVRRAFLEIVFDGAPEAKDNLAASIALLEQSRAETAARIQPADDAWVAPLLGAYEDPGLGRIELRRRGADVIVDVGEWSSTFAKLTDQDGAVKLVMTSPPYYGFTLTPRTQDGKTVLVLDAGQQVYTFAPVPGKPAKPAK